MSSIPLPALAIQPPQQQQSPLEIMAHVMGIRAKQQELQTGQLQQQGLQQENQMKALQLQDQQTLRNTAKGIDWTAPDAFTKLMQGAQQGGVSPQTLSQLALQRAQYQEQLAKTDTATLASDAERNNQLLGHIDAVKGVTDPAKRAQVAQTQAQQILNNPDIVKGIKDPGIQQMLGAMAQGQLVPNDDQLQSFEMGLMDHKTQVEMALKQKQGEEAGARTGEAQANTAKIQQETGFGPTGAAAEAQYRFLLKKVQAGAASPEEVAQIKAYEASQSKSTTQSDSLGITSSNTSRPSGLALAQRGGSGGMAGGSSASGNKPQSAANSIADMIGQYKVNPAQMARLTAKHPDILAAVEQKYPDWDQTTYNAKNKMVESYTSGPESKSIGAMNTALGHAAELGKAMDALNNGDAGLKFLRDLANKYGVQTGADAVTTYKTILHRLAPEITAAYVQGGGGEGERAANEQDFDPSLSNTQLHKNLAATIGLFRSKIAPQEQQWNTTYKPSRAEDAFQTRFLTPQAKEALQKYAGGQQGSGIVVTAPNGKAYSFKDQASADAFKQKAGIQ